MEGTESVPCIKAEGRPGLIFVCHLHLSYDLGFILEMEAPVVCYVLVVLVCLGCHVLWVFIVVSVCTNVEHSLAVIVVGVPVLVPFSM